MILYRHVIREHLLPFLYSLSILVFLFVMNYAIQILDQIITRGLDAGVVLEVFAINLGWMIALAVPMAILTSTLMAFGRMSADNEILAIRSSGVGLTRLIAPVVVAATLMCVMLIYFNNLILPDANHRTANLMSDIARKKPAALIDPGVLIRDFEHYALYVDEAEGRTGRLQGVKVFSDAPGEDPTTTVAASGDVRQTPDGAYLQLTLYNGETHSLDADKASQYFVGRFDRQVLFIKNVDSQLRRTNTSYRGDREKSSEMMLQDIEGYREQRATAMGQYNAALDTLAAVVARLDSSCGDTTAVAAVDSLRDLSEWAASLAGGFRAADNAVKRHATEVERLERRVRNQDLQIARYRVEVHKKYSIPVTCIVFVLIGAPLGIMARRGGLAVGASYSVFFFILFWAFLIQGEQLADNLKLSPFWAMWGGNILIGVCGIYLIVRMVRETTFIDYARIVLWWEKLGRRLRLPGRAAPRGLRRSIAQAPFRAASKAVGILPMYFVKLFSTYAFGVFAAILVVFTVVDYVSNTRRFAGIPMNEVARYYWYYLPWIIQMVFPVVMLLASMFAVGRLAKHCELVAIKAAGRSIRRATLPLLAVGGLFAFLSFYLGERVLPQANTQRQVLLEEMQQSRDKSKDGAFKRRDFHRNFYYFGDRNTVYCFEDFRTRPLKTRNVWRESFHGDRLVERIQAESADFRDGGWVFLKGSVRTVAGDSSSVAAFDTLADNVLRASPEEMVVKIKKPEEMSYWELSDYIDKARRRGEKVMQYLADLHFKIAYPFMNLIVILLGVSITARTGRGGGSVLFGIGLLLVFCYWILARCGLTLGKNGHLDPLLGAWIGNILFLTLGIFMYRRTDR